MRIYLCWYTFNGMTLRGLIAQYALRFISGGYLTTGEGTWHQLNKMCRNHEFIHVQSTMCTICIMHYAFTVRATMMGLGIFVYIEIVF